MVSSYHRYPNIQISRYPDIFLPQISKYPHISVSREVPWYLDSLTFQNFDAPRLPKMNFRIVTKFVLWELPRMKLNQTKRAKGSKSSWGLTFVWYPLNELIFISPFWFCKRLIKHNQPIMNLEIWKSFDQHAGNEQTKGPKKGAPVFTGISSALILSDCCDNV